MLCRGGAAGFEPCSPRRSGSARDIVDVLRLALRIVMTIYKVSALQKSTTPGAQRKGACVRLQRDLWGARFQLGFGKVGERPRRKSRPRADHVLFARGFIVLINDIVAELFLKHDCAFSEANEE